MQINKMIYYININAKTKLNNKQTMLKPNRSSANARYLLVKVIRRRRLWSPTSSIVTYFDGVIRSTIFNF